MKPLPEFLGESPGLNGIREELGRLLAHQRDARRLPPILIEGETGTGKGLLARMIHRTGPRADGPFVDVNCAAIPETLVEAEMFGFERGAFTDARRAKPGLLQTAHHGTIFLDEIALLPEPLQAKLLKVLEERVVRRLGSTRDEPVDVWILAATNEDVHAVMRAGRLREDLYHRLAVLTVRLPPLRERGDDVLLLAEHFLHRACAEYGVPTKRLTPDAKASLLAHPWPGNVRQLANLMERVALLADVADVTTDTLALPSMTPRHPPPERQAGDESSLDDAVRQRITAVLEQTRGNISRAAARLEISRNTLRARMAKYGIGTVLAGHTERARSSMPAPITRVEAKPLPVRWERRRVALLRATLVVPAGADVPYATSRILETVIEKVRTLGGRLDGVGPAGIIAVFGLEPLEAA
ncbi:MAG: sigma-54 interaction domain-containing protein, partial [Candidatus Rokuibacteriota bacterium]